MSDENKNESPQKNETPQTAATGTGAGTVTINPEQLAHLEQSLERAANKGSHGLLALALTFFFGPLGLFCSLYLLGKRSLIASLLFFVLYAVLSVIGIATIAMLIGIIILPVLWVIMLVHAYKAASNPRKREGAK